MTGHYKTGVLCILDGFGYREDSQDNGIKLAKTPTYSRLWDTVPRSWLKTSGLAVGLPEGQMGNSEVGHMNIGSGRVVMQDLPKIDTALSDGSLYTNPRLIEFIAKLKQSKGVAHLFGLMSPGGIHSHQDHMKSLSLHLAGQGIAVKLHLVADGRDTPPQSARQFLEIFETLEAESRLIKIASLGGRYFAMDRDNRWDRVEKAFTAMVHGKAKRVETARQAIEATYAAGKTDEFIEPVIIGDYAGMKPEDGFLIANFRADRARQLLSALVDEDFDGFSAPLFKPLAAVLGMVEYSSALSQKIPALFPSEDIRDCLGEVLGQHGIPQLRIAETEKYAHVTFFLNGGREDPIQGEDRILIPSPDVATYDLKPEMSAPELTDKLVEAIESRTYGLIIVNYANPDMVGHTGVLSAAIKAVETVDQCLARLEKAVTAIDGFMIITADHGNIELMRDQETGEPHTAHTNFDVPALLLGKENTELADGALSDLAPTLLDLMGLEQPAAMTGKSLVAPLSVNKQHTSTPSQTNTKAATREQEHS